MNNNNLVPITSTSQAREIGRKGGLVRSIKKKEAAKLREMRKRELSQKDLEWIRLQMVNPAASAFDILVYIQILKEEVSSSNTTITEKVKVIRLMLEWYKMWHGGKK
jgi:hypothetical protein